MMRFRLLSLLLLPVLFLAGCGEKRPAAETADVRIRVLDGMSLEPIGNARVVIPEGKCCAYTDQAGEAVLREIPVKRQDAPSRQPWGTFSLLVYREGYADYALFYAHLYEGQERSMKIFLFASDSPLSSGAPFSVVEGPDDDWVKEILNEYRMS